MTRTALALIVFAFVACDDAAEISTPDVLPPAVDASSIDGDAASPDAPDVFAPPPGDASVPGADGTSPGADAVGPGPDPDGTVIPNPDPDAGVEEPDVTPPPMGDCAAWNDVADDAVVAALHRKVQSMYRAIAPAADRGGRANRYTTARHLMFTEVEWIPPDDGGNVGSVEGVYTGQIFEMREGVEPDDELVNTEHTWPRSRLNSNQSGLLYSHQQSDIHHLLPTNSGANSMRGSYRFGEPVRDLNLSFSPAVLGEDARGDRVFRPRAERRGDVARIVFYMSSRWGLPIADGEEEVLRVWSADDPVDEREQTRNARIEGLQGNRNPFVDCPSLVSRIDDFASFETLDENLPSP